MHSTCKLVGGFDATQESTNKCGINVDDLPIAREVIPVKITRAGANRRCTIKSQPEKGMIVRCFRRSRGGYVSLFGLAHNFLVSEKSWEGARWKVKCF